MIREMLLECNIACYDQKLDNVGIENTHWLPFVIQWSRIIAIKSTGVTDAPDNYNNYGIIFTEDRSFTTDISFEELKETWINNTFI